MDDQSKNVNCCEVEDFTQKKITVKEHPKWYDPWCLIFGVIMCTLGSIIGMELIVRTGVTANTSIIGALFAVVLSLIPLRVFKKFKSIHRQNLLQTSISGATFSIANCMLMPVGIPMIMGRSDLFLPMLIGCTVATVIDATIIYKTFDTPMFPAAGENGGAWPPGVACAESILAVIEKGKKAALILVGMAMGAFGKFAGLPMDLLGVSWFGNFGAMAALGIGSIVIGSIKTNGFMFSLFGHKFTLLTNIFGEGFVYSEHLWVNYMPHGVMIGAGIISLVQCGMMLFKRKDAASASAAGQFTSSMKGMKGALTKGMVAYLIVALVLALVTGIVSDMSVPMFILWIIWAGFAALASELIVGISAMHSGWFPSFACTLIFLILGMLMGFPPLALGILAGYVAATGPCFSDMAYDMKCGYILRGSGADPELELEGRKQQFCSELLGFGIAFVMCLIFARRYFNNGDYVAVSKTFVAAIDAGASAEIAKWLFIWAVPGAIIQILGRHRQLGILFATGLLVGSTINGLTIIIALIIRYIVEKTHPEGKEALTILGAGSLAGAALYSFFSATLGLAKPKTK